MSLRLDVSMLSLALKTKLLPHEIPECLSTVEWSDSTKTTWPIDQLKEKRILYVLYFTEYLDHCTHTSLKILNPRHLHTWCFILLVFPSLFSAMFMAQEPGTRLDTAQIYTDIFDMALCYSSWFFFLKTEGVLLCLYFSQPRWLLIPGFHLSRPWI